MLLFKYIGNGKMVSYHFDTDNVNVALSKLFLNDSFSEYGTKPELWKNSVFFYISEEKIISIKIIKVSSRKGITYISEDNEITLDKEYILKIRDNF